MSENGSFETPVLIAEDAIIFPEMEVTIGVRSPKNVAAANQALKEHHLVVLIPRLGPKGAAGSIGTLVLLQKMVPGGGGAAQLYCKGLWRVQVERVIEDASLPRVRFTRAHSTDASSGTSAAMETVLGQIDEFVRVMPGIPPEIIAYVKSRDTPGKLADTCAYSPFFTFEERLDLLRTLDAEQRLRKVSLLFTKQLGELKRLASVTTIQDCPTCIDLADRALELEPGSDNVAKEFLDHLVREHPHEVLALVAERYGAAFLRRRELK
ncbi:MAG: LON peptidase substrate-binding domain-containing protein [Thaumarchaeota archaeon]|nr:LON peptidase substrate-binding domain-containing protein [Nitrososphaerota archaeon]